MRFYILLLLFYTFITSFGQSTPFSIYLEPLTISGVSGKQSFAYGQHDGKWLIVSGRTDGLHQRQPFASFDVAGQNNSLMVIDPIAQNAYSYSITSFPIHVKDQLNSTNTQFIQHDSFLYLCGGYGYSAEYNKHVTYSSVIAINVPASIRAIVNGISPLPYFRQYTDSLMAVAGGRIEKINETYYLIGGNLFMGSYNPMGPTHGPGFYQEYTNAIRKFHLNDDAISLSINHISEIIDTPHFHRRDFNCVPQILPSGAEAITSFSGVFQQSIDLPYLYCVNIDSSSYAPQAGFQQYYNHYQCPVIPLYDATNKEMHNLFFGGIAQYYDSAGILVQNNNVPFVKTIARVSRNASGNMAEYKLSESMPDYLGAGAEFIVNPILTRYHNGVIDIDAFSGDTILLGYIYGGILSSAPNIFFINNGTQSSATPRIYKVYWYKTAPNVIHTVNPQSKSNIAFQVFPMPVNELIYIQFNAKSGDSAELSLYETSGKKISHEKLQDLKEGQNTFEKKMNGLLNGYTFIIELRINGEVATQKIIVEP